MSAQKSEKSTIYTVTQKDLPLSCPPKNQEVWDMHPRVYLPIEAEKKVVCPYCSATYILK
ncbi:MAG: zinc-finger domain-containing protein [Gammaproteobacteria bacterium]|nr:zinc-finger domain-containing protein [Gammaproteobacteria bacterium]